MKKILKSLSIVVILLSSLSISAQTEINPGAVYEVDYTPVYQMINRISNNYNYKVDYTPSYHYNINYEVNRTGTYIKTNTVQKQVGYIKWDDVEVQVSTINLSNVNQFKVIIE